MSNWTQSMTMHLNGGKEWSQLNFAIFCDGKPTNIVRVTRTSGSKTGYLKTVDEFQCGEDTFDVLATRGAGMIAWLEAHRPIESPSDPSANAPDADES